MKADLAFPDFDDKFPELHRFILEVVAEHRNGGIDSWDDLDKQVKARFTAGMFETLGALTPLWRKMASYKNGVTLTHVICAFLGMIEMPEFRNLTLPQQGLMKWVILLHDVEKVAKDNKRDHVHAFRSSITAAETLPLFGFATGPLYDVTLQPWKEYTLQAVTHLSGIEGDVQDNQKLPYIVDGIDQMFGPREPAALIIKTILFHLSVKMREWPPAYPLTQEEMKRYFNADLLPLLRAMHLADTCGWSLFEPVHRERMLKDTNEIFNELDHSCMEETK